MPFVTSMILALNPEIEKYNYFGIPTDNIEYVSSFEPSLDLKKNYYLFNNSYFSKIDIIKEQFKEFFITDDLDLKISSDVYNNSYFIVDNLYPSICDKLLLDNIYTSNYGTLIIDWEKENGDTFSLEIGSKSLGYFIEIDGVDTKQVDEANIEESLSALLQDLSIFLA